MKKLMLMLFMILAVGVLEAEAQRSNRNCRQNDRPARQRNFDNNRNNSPINNEIIILRDGRRVINGNNGIIINRRNGNCNRRNNRTIIVNRRQNDGNRGRDRQREDNEVILR